MKRQLHKFILLIVASAFFCGCDIGKNKKEVPEYTLKIFNSALSKESYKTKDVITLPDGSYLVLSSTAIPNTSFSGINLSKISKEGDFQKTVTLDPTWSYAVPNLFAINQKYYTIAMDITSLSALLIEIDANLNVNLVSTITSVQYPISAGLDTDNQIVLQSYNREDKETVISKINITGNETARKAFPIGFGDNDVEIPILRHFTREAERLPFLSGTLGGGRYFFNGFYNYHLSMVYFSFNSNGSVKPGTLLGFETDRVVSSFLPLGAGKFAMSKADYEDNELVPLVTLNTSDAQFSSIESIKGYKLQELKGNTSIKIKRLTLKGKDVVVYVSDTKGKQIVLYFYDANTGVLRSTKYLGLTNPFEAGGISVTNDNGITVIGTCYVGGRYPKICYFSLTENQLTL